MLKSLSNNFLESWKGPLIWFCEFRRWWRWWWWLELLWTINIRERWLRSIQERCKFFHTAQWCPSTRAPLTFLTRTSHQKNRRRRNRKKRSKQKRAQEKKEQAEQQKKEGGGEKEKEKEKTSEVEIEYVTEEPEIYDPNFIFFKRIFEAFKVTHPTA